MKKRAGILLTVAVVIAFAFALWTKYDTRGVKPGAFDGHFSHYVYASDGGVGVFDVERSRSGYFLFENRFGRVVVAESTPEKARFRNGLTNAAYEKFGEVITNVRTIQPGIPTHLDFVGADNGSTTIFELVALAGMPATEVATPEPYEFTWVTVDGCRYHVGLETDSPIVTNLSVSYPGYTGTIEALQRQVVISYLVLAAILSGVLVVLLIVPKAVRKRKAEKLQNQEG